MSNTREKKPRQMTRIPADEQRKARKESAQRGWETKRAAKAAIEAAETLRGAFTTAPVGPHGVGCRCPAPKYLEAQSATLDDIEEIGYSLIRLVRTMRDDASVERAKKIVKDVESVLRSTGRQNAN